MVNLPEFLTTTIQLVLHVVLLVMAIRLYLSRRTPVALWLLLACISYSLVRFDWFSYDLVVYAFSAPLPQSRAPVLQPWKLYSGRILHILLLLCLIFTARAAKHENHRAATQTI